MAYPYLESDWYLCTQGGCGTSGLLYTHTHTHTHTHSAQGGSGIIIDLELEIVFSWPIWLSAGESWIGLYVIGQSPLPQICAKEQTMTPES